MECWTAIAPSLVSAALMLVAIRYLDGQLSNLSLLPRTLIMSGAGALVYVGLLALVGRRTLALMQGYAEGFVNRLRPRTTPH